MAKMRQWKRLTDDCYVDASGKYGVYRIADDWFAATRDPAGGLHQLDGPCDSLRAAKARVESHRWGFMSSGAES